MRIIQELKNNWWFGGKGPSVPTQVSKEAPWQQVSLPHTWNAVEGHLGHPYIRDAFWYVTTFVPDSFPTPHSRTYLEVGAASLQATVWVNGSRVGKHIGGFSSFRFDITEFCKEGENILAILCDNRYSETVYPQRADFIFYGGLYRYVRIITVPYSHINMDNYGSSGILIDTEPTDEGANIYIRALLTNPLENQVVQCVLREPNGTVVNECWEQARAETSLQCFLPDVHLWDGLEKGFLYTADIRLVSFNEVVDQVTVSFGVRSFHVDSSRGFFLNGNAYPLRGVCRHQDWLYIGNALTARAHEEDARLISEMGANCVRLAHYQQSAEMYDACDKFGLIVWAEIPYFVQTWNDEAHAAAVQEIRELCMQNYNHPSICFWGLSNEILMNGNDNPKLLACHQELNHAVKAIDSHRLTVIAHEYHTPWDHPLHAVSDVEGWNHYFGWYRGDIDDLGKWADRYHEAYPERAIAISEYGCDSILCYHSDNPQKMDYSEEYQVLLHEKACQTFASRPWIWGSFVWNMFDFGSFFRREGGTAGRNNKGLVTMDRKIKKDAYYVYKAWFSKEPFVHIAGRRYFARPQSNTTVRIHSNQEEVSLFVNNKLWQTQKGQHVFLFENVPLSQKGTTLVAKASKVSDTITLRSTETPVSSYVFSGFRQAQDARNWFEGVEDITGELTDAPGFYSVHDSMEHLLGNEAAEKTIRNGIIATTERPINKSLLRQGDLSRTAVEYLSEGMIASMLGSKRDTTIRRIHAVLKTIRKP